MAEINEIYHLRQSIKGWPVKGAETLQEASGMILGSPYWNIPEDRYVIIDGNETYSLLAVIREGKVSSQKRYMAVNMDIMGNSTKVCI